MPQSDVPGEWSSPTQPFPTRPAPYARQSFTEKDINPYLPKEQQDALRARMKTLRNEGLFTPPSFEGSIEMPGHNGGANFGTSAVDPIRGEYYVVHKSLPTVLHMALPGTGRGAGGGRGGNAIVTPEQKAALMAQAKELVAQANGTRLEFLSPVEFMTVGFPGGSMSAVGPPWSEMVKYDLNTGDIKWRIPTGERRRAAGIQHPEGYRCPVSAERAARDRGRPDLPRHGTGAEGARLRPRQRQGAVGALAAERLRRHAGDV